MDDNMRKRIGRQYRGGGPEGRTRGRWGRPLTRKHPRNEGKTSGRAAGVKKSKSRRGVRLPVTEDGRARDGCGASVRACCEEGGDQQLSFSRPAPHGGHKNRRMILS